MNNWTAKTSPRIWRAPESSFYGDEPLNALEVYTDSKLQQIAEHGFNSVWLRGRLYDLMKSSVFAELNRSHAQQRMANLLELINRAKRHGIEVYLFFNEPLALPADDSFWDNHAQVKGEPCRQPEINVDTFSLCTSTPQVKRFFQEAVEDVLHRLPGLGGVILITATEYHSHCWSHRARYSLSDGIVSQNDEPMQCPRCRGREPADVVLDLIQTWLNAASQIEPRPRVVAWNWSWSIWYPDPQGPIIEHLPEGVERLLDWERGGIKRMLGRDILIDEYSMGYAGPSPRCVQSLRLAQGKSTPVLAKLQIGTTHEMATVPNLPLIHKLHDKLSGLYKENVAGVMATWNFGCSLTLNSFAVGLFCKKPKLSLDCQWFLRELAQTYFGSVDYSAVARAWLSFSAAFDHFPFSIKMLYFGPVNDAPAYPLTLEYRNAPMGPSWLAHDFGDCLDDCLGEFSLDEVTNAFGEMSKHWEKGLTGYCEALSSTDPGTQDQIRHRLEELSCARMIACQLRCALEIFRFHRWRLGVIAAKHLQPPCKVPADKQAVAILKRQIENAKEAQTLTKADTRLGFHQEPQAQFYDPAKIQQAIAVMRREVEAVG